MLATLAALAACAPSAHAGEAPGDSLLNSHVRSMSDSTDAWFGITAAPVDTAGLDSALASGLALPPGTRRAGGRARRSLGLAWSPAPGFNRADGGQLGAGLALTSPLPGRLTGRAQYTTGTHDLLGEGAWATSWRLPGLHPRLAFRAAAGRWTEPFDRDHYDPVVSTISALLHGGDRHQYVRRDGFTALVRLSGESGFALVGWRDQLESALPYTTSWTLFGGEPTLRYVTPATHGRARELALQGDVTVPGTRFRVNLAHWTSDPRMGSDFRYRRTRLSVGGDVSLGRHLALLPQAMYGRLRGGALPQDAFYLGGGSSLRTLERNERLGAGKAFSRVDLILADDLRTLLRVPLPAWLPIQGGVFGAIGAVWGQDASGGAATPTERDWPRAEEWLPEVGGGLSWRHGVPNPSSSVRFEYSVPLGADSRDAKFTVTFQRPMSLLPVR